MEWSFMQWAVLSTRNYDFFWLEAVFPGACNGLSRGVSLGRDGGMSAGLKLMFLVFFAF
jgi:hypothetical protein